MSESVSSHKSTQKTVCVAVVGTGLVGSAFLSQLAGFPTPSPFRLISLSSSRKSVFVPSGIPLGPCDDVISALNESNESPDLKKLTDDLANQVQPGQRVVLVDNTASADVANAYPLFLSAGIDVITPNKKAFSGSLSLYKAILSASLESGAKFLNESTVGAGLPVVGTLKDLVATGDRVKKIEGVLSGTLSYIFNEFSVAGKAGGPSYSEVVRVAKEKGYTVSYL